MLLPFDRVRNTLSASVPVMYKFTENDPANATQSLQAFSMQLFIYTLLRSFVFFLVGKQLVAVPSRHGSPVPLSAELMSSPSLTSFSPQPLNPSSVGSALPALPAGYVADASAALGIAMDGCGDDIEFKKTVNAPTIAADERVEITRVNRWGLWCGVTDRYLSCSLVSKEGAAQSVYLAVGRSQLSLLEMVRGSMKDAVVRCVFSLYELLDICVEDNTRRTLSLLVGEEGGHEA